MIDKIFSKCMIVLLMVIACFSCEGQITPTAVVNQSYNRIDTFNTETSMYFPFDRPFYLKWPNIGKQQVVSASLFNLSKNFFYKKKYKKSIKFDISTQDTSGCKYIKISYLEPAKKYTLILNYIYPPKNINDVIAKLDAGKIDSAKLAYNENEILYIVNFNCKNCQADTFEKENFNDFLSYYLDKYIGSIDKSIIDFRLRLKELKIDSGLKQITKISKPTYFKSFIAFSKNCEACKDTFFQFQNTIQNRYSFTNMVASLADLQDDEAKAISYGYITTDSLGFNLYFDTLKNNSTIRINNLRSSIQKLYNYKKYIKYYEYEKDVYDANYVQAIQEQISILEVNYLCLYVYKTKVDSLNKNIQKLQDSTNLLINNCYCFLKPIAQTAPNTWQYDFQTRTGFAVKPDFGFIVYGNVLFSATEKNGKINARFWGVSPFIGFHVNVRPMDTDVPFVKIKGFSKHLSFCGGALITSFTANGQTEGIVGNTSIFTGMGYAFSHAIRLTFGSIWFKRENVNPLISQNSVAAAPYAGISIDLRVRDVFNAFSNIL